MCEKKVHKDPIESSADVEYKCDIFIYNVGRRHKKAIIDGTLCVGKRMLANR